MGMTREEMLAKRGDLAVVEVPIEEWGTEVHVRCMTGKYRDQYEEVVLSRRSEDGTLLSMSGLRARLISMTVCDESGSLLFDQDGDLEAIDDLSGAVLDRLWDAAREVSGLGQEDEEELEGN